MAQPLTKPDSTTTGGIDAAAVRLEEAFRRLDAVVATTQATRKSLKGDQEKLSVLLREAEEKIARLKETTNAVVKRLDRTISALEKEESAL